MAEEFLAYLAQDRRHAIAAGVELPDRAVGAALFADVAGFTPLAEAFAASLGPRRGAEELTALLNRIYGALIAEVNRFGGSVVTFSGDAVTCWFDDFERLETRGLRLGEQCLDKLASSPKPLASPTLRAVACALAMQRAMAPFAAVTAGGVTASLVVKIAVAAGPARRFCLGDPQVQLLDVLAGATLDRLATAAALAGPHEVLLDEATAQLLEPAVTLAEWRGARAAVLAGLTLDVPDAPWPALAPDAVPAAVARHWLVPAVAERVLHDDLFLAELRPAVALMMQFGGLDYDGDAAGALLDGFVRHVQRIVTSYGGVLVDITMADKGGYLYTAFGAPVAREQDARRAVLAALELQALRVHPTAPPPRIGISCGTMRAGAYGGAGRRTYGVLGDDVNLACRLMDRAAPGEILASQRVREVAGADCGWTAQAPVRLKGKRDEVPVFSLTSERPAEIDVARSSHRTLSGRAHERAVLQRAAASLQTGAGGVLLLEGEPGIGKSRLLAKFQSLLPPMVACLAGAGQSIEQRTPYRAWRELLAALFGFSMADTSQTRCDRVLAFAAQLAPELYDRLPLLADVLEIELPESDVTRALDARLRGESVADLVVGLVRVRAAAQPVALVIDDAHWLDSRSWSLVVAVAQALVVERLPVLLVVATRPQDAQQPGWRQLPALLRLPGCERLVLRELAPADVHALLAERLGVAAAAIPEQLRALVQERSGGNPLFAEELLAALLDARLVRVEHDGTAIRCSVAPGLEEAAGLLPETLQALLLARIDRLPVEQQLTLKVAAVIGPTFAYPPLHSTHARHAATDGTALKHELRTLAALSYTWLEEPEPNLAYSFKHVLVQEAAYETLLYAQRRELHLAVARWYERRASDSAYPLLTHHYRRAEEPERERHYARLAGIQAAEQYANDEAVAYFSRALELTPADDHATRFELLLARQHVYDLVGQREAQHADLLLLEALAETLAEPHRRITVALWQARYANATGDFLAGAAAAKRAAELAHQAVDGELEAQGHLKHGEALSRRAEYAEAEAALTRALDLARGAGLAGVEADALRALGLLCWYQSNYQQARAFAQQSIAIYRATGDRRGEAEALATLGNIAREHADYERAHQCYSETMALCRAIGDRTRAAWTLYHLGTVAAGRGDLAAALEFYCASLPAFQLTGNAEGEGWARGNLGKVGFTQGRYAEARRDHEQSLAIFRTIGQRGGEGWALNSLGNVALAQGDYDAARAYYRQALELARATGSKREETDILVNLGQIAASTGDYATARELFEASLVLCRAIGKRFGETYALDGLGVAALALGDPVAAHTYHQTSLELAREIGFRQSQGWSLLGLGAVAAAAGDHQAASVLAGEALALFDALGNRRGKAAALVARGAALLALGDPVAAAEAYRAALELRQTLGLRHQEEEARSGLERAAGMRSGQ
jgi:predicted ATPase/class 3 adenylate cyclase